MYFITLGFLVRKIFTFSINDVLLFKCPFPGRYLQEEKTSSDRENLQFIGSMNYNLLFIPVYLALNNMIILQMINEGEARLIRFNSDLTAKRGEETIQTGKTPT